MKKLIFARRSSQVFFLSLFIYILWSTTYPLKGFLPPGLFFKIDPLVSTFSVFSIMMFILTFIIGRFFCGWVCPFGVIIDAFGIKAKNRDLNLRQVKYYILGLIVVCAFIGVQIAWFFDPIVITARFISLNFIPSVTLILNKFFIFLIKSSDFYSPLYDFYRFLKSSALGIKIYYFSHSFITLAFFLIILSLLAITKRFWCRVLCPLGAIYALISKFSLLERHVDKCTHCMKCNVECRMSAIKEDSSYRKEECILCMDCIYACPDLATKFSWPEKKPAIRSQSRYGISRGDFLFLIASSFLLSGFRYGDLYGKNKLIRPPGVLGESEFLDKCVRCGNCMRVCPTNVLQPVIFESGLSGIWAPYLVFEIGYCEYNCNLCGRVCPTGAIPKLSLAQKKEQKLGIAAIDKNICFPWAQNKECIVCEEHCPVPSKAIKLYDEILKGKNIQKPYVDISLCIGCGICQTKCPTRPIRAIRVTP